jgi:hypothetical protein
MIGVWLLFKLKDKYFDKLKIGFKIEKKIPFARDSKPLDLVNSASRQIKSEFNKMIDDVTIANSITNKKATRAMLLILTGFLIQTLSYLYKIFFL